MQSLTRKTHACLAVTRHLHFWQNDRGLLRATAVTRGWNGYRNKSQHRKLTLEKKILPPLLQGFKPATFWSRVRRTNHWAIPTVSESRENTIVSANLLFLVTTTTKTKTKTANQNELRLRRNGYSKACIVKLIEHAWGLDQEGLFVYRPPIRPRLGTVNMQLQT